MCKVNTTQTLHMDPAAKQKETPAREYQQAEEQHTSIHIMQDKQTAET